MKAKACAIAVAALLALPVLPAGAEEALNVVGYNRITAPANSDVIVGVPFNQQAIGEYAVASVTGTGLTVAGSPWTAGAYNNLYYVRMTSGTADGRWATVSSNTANELVLADTSFLGDLAVGDTFALYPHQTLSKVFPDGLAGRSFIASTGSGFGLQIKTRVLLWTPTVGTNQSPAQTYYFHESGQWRTLAGANADNTVIAPNAVMVVRNSEDRELEYVVQGSVHLDAQAQVLQTHASPDDTYTFTGRPVPVKLKELGLGGTPAFQSSTGSGFGLVIKDKLLVFNNAATGTTKAPVATYYYHESGQWRTLAGANADDVEIGPSAGMVIRKIAGTPGDDVWTAQPPF